MIAMNNLYADLLHCQQRTQNKNTHALQVIHQSQRDHVSDSLIEDIPIFDGNQNYILIGI